MKSKENLKEQQMGDVKFIDRETFNRIVLSLCGQRNVDKKENIKNY